MAGRAGLKATRLDPLEAAGAAGPPSLVASGGTIVATACAGAVSVLCPGRSPILLKADSTSKPIASLAVSRDGQWIAAGQRGAKLALFLWRAAAADGGAAGWAQPALEIARAQHNFGIAALAFSPSGRLLASHGAERDHQVVLWSPQASGKQLGRARIKESYDAIAFAAEDSLVCINRHNLAVWALERCTSPGGNSMKLACRSFALPPLPSHARFVGLAAAAAQPGGNPRAVPRLLAATDGGRLLRLRAGGPTVDKAVDVQLLQGAKLMHLAVSGELVAVATSGGTIALYSAASLELAGVLPSAQGSQGGRCSRDAVLGCAFSPDGQALTACTAGGQLVAWHLADLQHPTPALMSQSHSEAITDAVIVPGGGEGGSRLATCSLDGSLQLWECASSGALRCAATLDLRAQLKSAATKLLCLASSPDGRLLAAGDAAGCVHLVAVASSAAAPARLATQLAHADDVTALCFAAPCAEAEAEPAPGSQPLLAAASRRGLIKVLRVQLDGTCTQVATVAEHQAAVTGLALPAGGAWLVSADRGGKRLMHRLDAAAGTSQVVAQAAIPRCSFVGGLAQGLRGQSLVGASRTGKVYTCDVSGQEMGVVQVLERNQGELASFAIDESLSLLCAATTHGQLLLCSLAGGKTVPVAACRAHLAGTAISKVLITPDSRCIVSVGEDASVRSYRLPASSTALCCEAQQRPRTVACDVEAPAGSGSCSRALSESVTSAIRPRDLLAAMDEEVASGPQEPAEEEDAAIPASAAPPQDLVPQAVTTLLIPPAPQPDAANLLAPAAVLDTAEDCEDVAPRAASIPPSPNRHAMLGGRQAQLEELLELQARFAAMKPRGGACAGQGQETAPPAAVAAAAPAAAPPAAASPAPPPPAGSPGPIFGSPYQSISSLSLGALSSPALHSPDVFSDLEEPAGGGSEAALPATTSWHPLRGAAAPKGPTLLPTSPLQPGPDAAGGGSNTEAGAARDSGRQGGDAPHIAKLKSGRSARLQRLVRTRHDSADLLYSPLPRTGQRVAGSTPPHASATASVARGRPDRETPGCVPGPEEGPAPAAAAEAAAPATAPASPPDGPAGASTPPAPCSATVDIGGEGSPLGSASVNQTRRRRSWGPVPSSEPRRALSSLSSCGSADPEAAGFGAEQRRHSALGIEQPPATDGFSVYADSSAKGTPAAAGSSCSGGGSSTSRRLSFSFGGGGLAFGCTESKHEDTPPLPGQPKPGGAAEPTAAGPALAFRWAGYSSPGLPGAAPSSGATDSTPRIFLAPAAAVAAPAMPAADGAPRAQLASHAIPGTAASCAAGPAMRDRPAVPRLNLAAVQAAPEQPAAASGGSSAAFAQKRSRQAREAASPAESAASTGTGGSPWSTGGGIDSPPAGVEAWEAAAAAGAATPDPGGTASPASKKSRPALPSPPRLVIDCQLFSPELSAGRPQAPAAAATDAAPDAPSGTSASQERPASLWPVAAGSCSAAGAAAGAPEALDPFSRPASYDPLATAEQDAPGGVLPAPPPAVALDQSPAASHDAAGSSDSAPASSLTLPAASPASGSRGGSSAEEAQAAAGPAEVLRFFRQGLQVLASLQQAGIGGSGGLLDAAAFRAELLDIAGQLHRAADHVAPPGDGGGASAAVVAGGQENVHSNGGGCPADLAARADLAVLKQQMGELRRELAQLRSK